MQIAVLMAGLGKRFVDAGFSTPKPLIKVNDKTILDWTLSSVQTLVEKNPLSFAVRKEHEDEYKIIENLKEKYGEKTKFILCDGPIKGNLFTACELSKQLFNNKLEPILFLDSDNIYNSTNFENLLENIQEKDFVVLCYFELKDKNDLKWGFCSVNEGDSRVIALKEKEFLENGKPMVGFFYWSSIKLFEQIASEVFQNEPPGKNNEYYLTQGVSHALKNGISVHAFKSEHMVALGTPEDVEKFEKS